ncbi:PMT-domain-containing protein [Anaeromyces robustus]|uniref:Dolichyl-phosphate-mannose--protein mannosyltransferase n=1 Tax=Anaeromyces robustus TaxID=1754192 RepID=A0A1Y1XAM9_9FUNG|nr:PMT-domain-containing protein [Anaeromyces robustus]|eukprot:ORX82773.1 PMT-domain-containing protein [Anaeromyces robustus]
MKDKKKNNIIISIILFVISYFIRTYAIGRSKVVVWDETHFALATSEYVGKRFFFDLHPPLGKQILALVGYFVKFDVNLYTNFFPFPGGANYVEGLNYIALRTVCAFFGAMIIPLTYLSAIELKLSQRTSILLGILIAIENSLVVISKFILLDAFLLFFNALTCYCFLKFNNTKKKEFSYSWWRWQILLGISLGGLISIKWTGFQTYGLIGLVTIYDLFVYYMKNYKNLKSYLGHWISRIICLIIIPFAIYSSLFYIHFNWFEYSGDGSPKMSTAFKSRLKGNTLYGPLEVTSNSTVTIKNSRIGGGNLFCTPKSKYYNNWVSTYLLNDPGINWIIKKDPANNKNEKKYIYDGDIIEIVHKNTNTYLTTTLYDKAPFTKSMKRVISRDGVQEHSLWKIEFVKNPNITKFIKLKRGHFEEIPDVLHPISTKFRLRNKKFNCLLRSHNVVLPMSKGWKRLEAGCDFEHENSWETVWHIENNTPETNPGLSYMYEWNIPQSFWRDFLDYHSAMINVNKMIEPFPRTTMRLDSHPKKWPFLNVGVRMLNWDDNTVKFYLLGNPFIWWLSTISIICLSATFIIKLKNKKSIFAECFVLMGWMINYIPFYIVGRMTYLHHYLVSLYFSIICLAILLDFYILPIIKIPIIKRLFILFFILIAISISAFFSPFVYGFQGPAINMKNRQWLKTWNIY